MCHVSQYKVNNVCMYTSKQQADHDISGDSVPSKRDHSVHKLTAKLESNAAILKRKHSNDALCFFSVILPLFVRHWDS